MVHSVMKQNKPEYELVKIHKENDRITKILCKPLEDVNIGCLEFARHDMIISINMKIQKFFVRDSVSNKMIPVHVVQEQDPELFLTTTPNDKCRDNLGELPEF